jgi:glycosyltransferase involved in cell wall biosynthesis
LLEAISNLTPPERRSLQFTHYGEAPSDPESLAYAAALQDRIRAGKLEDCASFQGPCFDIPRRLLESDWFILPSINEPCSVALIEALALGKPALVSASGGNVDIVSHGKTGLLFAPDNVQDLTLKLRQLLSSQGSITAPSEIRRSVECRRAAHVARRYRELYQELIPTTHTVARKAPGTSSTTP